MKNILRGVTDVFVSRFRSPIHAELLHGYLKMESREAGSGGVLQARQAVHGARRMDPCMTSVRDILLFLLERLEK